MSFYLPPQMAAAFRAVLYKQAAPPSLSELREARQQTDTDPTPAQQQAGNYRKGKVRFHGLTISIENPKGSVRSGVSADGKAWSNRLHHDYGYVLRTEGRDGDQVDVFLGPDLRSEAVFVINQTDPRTGRFDEHKVMLGFDNQADAKRAYLSNYDRGWQGLGSICPLSLPQFKRWVREADLSRPLSPSVRMRGPDLLIGPEVRKAAAAALQVLLDR